MVAWQIVYSIQVSFVIDRKKNSSLCEGWGVSSLHIKGQI